MSLKRLITTAIGLPVVILILLYGNKYVMDIVIAVVATISIYEYSRCCKEKAKIISWVGYVCAISIAFIHIIPEHIIELIKLSVMPTLLFVLFLHAILSNMKISFEDIVYTFFGVFYICGCLLFMSLTYGIEGNIPGTILIWYMMFAAWSTDTFAYLIGRNFGKHHFSKVSPNKTIEGCIAGTILAIIIIIGFTFVINKYFGYNISYMTIGIIGLILSIIGQIGDFAASVIKRHFKIKDFSELFPGHGGMIDRMDSVMFIAPFAYILLTQLIK